MRFDTNPSEPRQRRYPVLWIFDLAFNFALSAGVLMLACLCLALILSHNAPHFLSQMGWFAARTFR